MTIKKIKKYTLAAAFITAGSYAATAKASSSTRTVECTATDTNQLNRFLLQGTIEISAKSIATGDVTLTTQMAGKDAAISDSVLIPATGTARTYPAKSLGVNEVTLVRLKGEAQGRVYNLTIASGLLGPQSTLVVQNIPFRAECKLQ